MTSYKNPLISGRGLFVDSKYPGEFHAHGYSYLGPGSRLDIRLDNNFKPRKGEEPINQLDSIALKHDISYDKIKKEYLKDGNKQKALNAIHNSDNSFIQQARSSNVQPLGTIASGIIKAKQLAEDAGVLSTKTFSGMGKKNQVAFATKSGKVVTFSKKPPDPTARLKKLAGVEAPIKEKKKKMRGGLGPLAVGVISALAGTALDKIFTLIKDKISGSGFNMDPELYKSESHKRAFIKRVLY